MKQILVPTDFSVQAEAALSLAAEMAKANSAELTVLHVVEIPNHQSFSTTGTVAYGGDPMEGVWIKKMIEKGERQLANVAASPMMEGVNVKTKIRAGNAYYNMSDIIAEQMPDLIVMGTSGATGAEEILIGSNTEKVVRNSKVPVLSVKKKMKLSDFNNILLASEMKNEGIELVRELKIIVKHANAKMHLLRVNTPNNFEGSAHTMKRMKAYVEKNGLDAEQHIYNSTTEEEGIMEFATSNHIDLIAMGTHGRKGLMHLLSGSIAEDVVNHSEIPVLTFKLED
ncbi:MAG: nucleotide-binding universal stress UspA family protein [Marivirga sp.]|jgi:nucleotide-binding universal stress UspA family protein